MGRRRSKKHRRLRLESLEARNLLTVMIGVREFPTIQEAIDNAVAGNQIEVSDGLYEEALDLTRMGSAIGRGPGNLSIRGVESAAGAVIRPPTGTAITNSAAVTADLLFSQLTIESPTVDPSSDGITLNQVTGRVELHDLVFQNIDRNALTVNALTGSLSLLRGNFTATGTNGASTAITLTGIDGSAVVNANTLTDVEGTALAINQGGGAEATIAVTGNTIKGDSNFFATTVNGVVTTVFADAALDLTLDDNTLEDLSGRAIDVSVSGQSRLQLRLTSNDISNVTGDAAVTIAASGTTNMALTAVDNNILNASDDGLLLSVQDTARVAALLRNNLFLLIGDAATDRGLVITSTSGSAGSMAVFMDNNTFDTISGDGLVTSLDGATEGSLTIINNFFTGINSLGGTAALVVENVAGSTSEIQTTIHDNQVLDSLGDAFRLTQQGGVLALATVNNNTPQNQLAATNNGGPITVNGLVTPIAEDALQTSRLLIAGDQAWIDADGDGIRQTGEAPLAFATLNLTGTETESGAQVQRTTVTDANGRYLFGALFAGTYTITYTNQLGFKVAPTDQGEDDTVDNDFATATRQVSFTLTDDNATIDLGVVRTWQNPRNRLDVNNDGLVTANDVLRLINDINNNNRTEPLPLPDGQSGPPPFLDPNNDGFVTPNDVLQVINFLNGEIGGEGEGEASGRNFNFAASPRTGHIDSPPEASRRRAGFPRQDLERQSVDNFFAAAQRSGAAWF